jgi:hypothetical protein
LPTNSGAATDGDAASPGSPCTSSSRSRSRCRRRHARSSRRASGAAGARAGGYRADLLVDATSQEDEPAQRAVPPNGSGHGCPSCPRSAGHSNETALTVRFRRDLRGAPRRDGTELVNVVTTLRQTDRDEAHGTFSGAPERGKDVLRPCPTRRNAPPPRRPASFRGAAISTDTVPGLGFRCVRNAKGESTATP